MTGASIVRSKHSILALLSARGGGDKGPVLALAAALHARGHTVYFIGDGNVEAAIAQTGLPSIYLPRAFEQEAFYDPLTVQRMAARGEQIEADTPDPLLPWALACLPHAIREASALGPAVVLSTLFCMPLAEMIAKEFRVPWVFINPGCYFGDDARRPWEADYPGIVAGMFRHWLVPPMQRASLVLHATDPIFDPPPPTLASNHHYVGPLELDDVLKTSAPSFLEEAGDPWVLITLSTVPQLDEVALARAALQGLADLPVRVLLTLAPGHAREQLGSIPLNARVEGFVPHGPVLNLACLIIGHAGHGMVMKALRHGVPMVLVPWGRDQTAVATRAQAMGAAEIVLRSECTIANITSAVERVLGDAGDLRAARSASARLRASDPLGAASQLIEQLLES